MTTGEDAFSLYERNAANTYHDCARLNRLETCPIKWEGKCLCQFNVPVFSTTIGNAEVPCDIKRRCYVKPGQECPVCFEDINQSSILSCGHKIHSGCIILSKKICCPMCRQNIKLTRDELGKIYDLNN
jgi:hypothetical protein